MAFDSHMHINSLYFNDFNDAINKINGNPNISGVINVGMSIQTSKEAIEIANNNPKFYASIGIHPLHLRGENVYELYNLYNNDKVVAVGEIGFDDSFKDYEAQKLYLIMQIRMANELGLPVIIHSNNSNIKVMDIFERYAKPEYGCVFHCFQPDLQFLEYIIQNKMYISFAGRITYKNAYKSIEVAKRIPNEYFLVETDSPLMSPEPYRSQINSSENIKYVIQKLAEVKGMSYEDIENITSENTRRLFRKIK